MWALSGSVGHAADCRHISIMTSQLGSLWSRGRGHCCLGQVNHCPSASVYLLWVCHGHAVVTMEVKHRKGAAKEARDKHPACRVQTHLLIVSVDNGFCLLSCRQQQMFWEVVVGKGKCYYTVKKEMSVDFMVRNCQITVFNIINSICSIWWNSDISKPLFI